MSLPWRFTSVDQYVNGTIDRLHAASPFSYKHLNIGKYFLSDDDLTAKHLEDILQAAKSSPYVIELTLCGITTLQKDTPALKRLTELLLTRTWTRITFSSCCGDFLSALSSGNKKYPVIKAICIKNCDLSTSGMVTLRENLIANLLLTRLEMSEVDLCDTSSASTSTIMRPLAEGVALSKSLEHLELTYCFLNTASIDCLSRDGLSKNQSLVSLNLPGCELEDDAVRLVVEGVMHHPTLRHLKLFRNHCGEGGVAALAKLLRKPQDDGSQSTTTTTNNNFTELESLDLSYQQFERAEKLNVRLLANSLGQNKSLKNLTLSFNKLNDADAECLAEGLKRSKNLEQIDLRANNIRDKGAVALAEGVVRQSPKLRKFCMYGNPLGEKGAQSLLAAIRTNPEILIMNMDHNLSVYDEIQYFAYLNQVGRRLLKEDNFNPALWTVVIERAKRVSLETRGVCSAADLIFPFIRESSMFNSLGRSTQQPA